MHTHRAYSLLEIKASDPAPDGRRTFTGTATTPSVDRGGDIVEPGGAEFKLPIPLLWQHDARAPIGWVTAAKVSKAGIDVTGELARVAEPGALKDRLDEAWQSMQAKLVRGLSIGFKPLESSRIGDTYSYRFTKWLWLELSAVTIPMNGDCSIIGIKSADSLALRTASGAQQSARPVVRLDVRTPGATGAHDHDGRTRGVVYLRP